MKNKTTPSTHARTLLIIDDDRLLCDSVQFTFKAAPFNVFTAHSGAEGLRLCADQTVDVILLDQKLPDGDGVDFCAPLMEHNESAKIIFITAFPSFENAVQAIKAGAHDYLSKPFELGELELTIQQALRTLDLEHMEQVQHFQRKQESDRTVLVGAANGLSEIERLVTLAAANSAPVLITGETGTGKTLVAKTIHFRSPHAGNAFISVNCAAIPENLMEAELFGHEKGAFTGAVAAGKGLFEMAEDGTLFLDEIGEMPFHLQSKLLGVLDDHQIRRLGGQSFKPVHVRVIAATNADLAQAVKEKRFREDLYYRLGVMHIHVPPLRGRPADIAGLVRHFIAQIAPDRTIRVSEEELHRLGQYAWPGNVRELRNVIERAILLSDSADIFPSRLLVQSQSASAPMAETSHTDPIQSLMAAEGDHIRKALAHFQHNHTHAAKALGISRSTLVRKIKTHRLE
ncbi:MAG: sigma-54 dependent transcriptional regulator [Desulfobacteraceae bacterium]|nr:sigma-54 dependent transcriptional regulator [Desulfobacteraceae bacterium]